MAGRRQGVPEGDSSCLVPVPCAWGFSGKPQHSASSGQSTWLALVFRREEETERSGSEEEEVESEAE